MLKLTFTKKGKYMWEINKSFSCDYSHRVYVQELSEEFCACGDTKTKCRRIHGHTGNIHLYVEGDVDHRGMVVDFKEMGFIGDFIDNQIDHRCVIDYNDPGFEQITHGTISFKEDGPHIINNKEVFFKKPEYFTFKHQDGSEQKLKLIPVLMEGVVAGYNIDLSENDQLSETQTDILESWFIVDFVPTSERLCQFLYKLAQAKFDKLGVKVSKVLWQETPKSQAVYKAK